jgi:nucleolar pre-ribosomal-associated protein 1
VSIGSLLDVWAPSGSLSCDSVLGAVQSLDPVRILRTSLAYPDWRALGTDDSIYLQKGDNDEDYDPVFLTLLFGCMLSSKTPERGTGWVQVMRTNIVGMFIRMLSSQHAEMRQLALSQLTAFWKCLEVCHFFDIYFSFLSDFSPSQDADLQEKPHVTYLFRLLKDALVYDEDNVQRLPSYISLLLFHALRGIFYPANFIYPHTARFLLQRPTLDLKDVPMLYGMLYSSSDEWKKERAWIIRFLADGMLSNADWQVFKRRHTWDLLASLFQSLEDKDRGLRKGILEVCKLGACRGPIIEHRRRF